MLQTVSFLQNIPTEKLKVWVLAPHLQTNDSNIDYYYDFTQSIAEYTKVFAELNMAWQWQLVTIQNFTTIIDDIVAEKIKGNHFPVLLNICDGDEVNGTPGISVVKYLEEKEVVYTGADEYFYNITTSKIPMKQAFDAHQVPNAKWEAIKTSTQYTNGIFGRLGTPIIVKPSVSGGSMGVGIKNVVENKAELNKQILQMFKGYRGWNLAADGLIAESFVTGPEFTVFISGSYNQPQHAKIYTPVQRIFHASLPDKEKFLSFDRLWEIYEDEQAMPNDENFYEYAIPDAALINDIKKISWDAYVACKGTGYTRVDVRMCEATKKLYVLEVNAQCGLSEDENFTSIGAILKVSNASFTSLVVEIINDAFLRKENLPADMAGYAEKLHANK
jgi:D-alanine-D-alanine ligase